MKRKHKKAEVEGEDFVKLSSLPNGEKQITFSKLIDDLKISGKAVPNFKNLKRSRGAIGLSHDKLNLGEAEISYDGRRDENRLGIYYRPSGLVKSLGYVIPAFFGLLFGCNVYRIVPEPYKAPAAIAGALLFTFMEKKWLDFLYKQVKT